MKKGAKKILRLFLVFVMMLSLLPASIHDVHGATSYTFKEITSEDEIIEGMRYIITAELKKNGADYVAVLGSNANSYNGYRYGYEVTKNSDGTIILNDSSSYLKLRFEASDLTKNRYELKADNGKYLYGLCYTGSGSANAGRNCCSLMPLVESGRTYGEEWWQFNVQSDGTWRIAAELDWNSYKGAEVIKYNETYGGFKAADANVLKVDNITETETNIHLYREICIHEDSDVTHVAGVKSSCTNVGAMDSYYCANCNTWASDNEFKNTVNFVDTFIPALDHNFVDGKCSECNTSLTSDTYEIFDSYSYGEELDGEKLIIVGKLGDKYYAMGHKTTDYNRNAVEVTKLANGKIEAKSDAEIFEFDYDKKTSWYTADGAELVYYDQRLIMMPKDRQNKTYDWLIYSLPDYDEEFGSFTTWDYKNKKTAGVVLVDGENGPYFTVKFFTNGDEAKGINVYKSTCKHTNMQSYPYVAPTCTQQGSAAYEYCPTCDSYFQNGDYTNSVIADDHDWRINPFTLKAKGHNFVGDQCTRCSLKVPVYTKITNQAQFDALSDEAMYIFAVEIDGKTYALQMPKNNPYLFDGDGTGEADLFEIDTNNNGVADCVEDLDLDSNGTPDYLEDVDGDGVCDDWDVYCLQEYLVDNFYNDMQTHNTVEAVVNSDGTLSVKDKDAFEFTLYSLGETKPGYERGYAFTIPNYVVSGRIRHFFRNALGLFERQYGDEPGVGEIQEYGNWDINFDDGEKIINPWYEEDYPDLYDKYILEEGNTGKVYALCTGFAPSYGQELRIRMITNDTTGEKEFYFITGDLGNDIELDQELPPVPEGCTQTILPIYLYGSEAVYGEAHVHKYGNWAPSSDENKHERVCSCGEKEVDTCKFDEGKVTLEPTEDTEGERTYTCEVCGRTKEEAIDKLPHTHEYGKWTPSAEQDKHERVCKCGEKEEGTCTWDEGTVTLEPTEETEGERTYTCDVCYRIRKEAIDKLPHTHKYGEWTPSNDQDKHERECVCGDKEEQSCTWDEGKVTLEPTEETEGQRTYTCELCGRTKTEAIDKLPHTHKYGEWTSILTVEDGHERVCNCGERETESCTWDEGKVTLEPTEEAEGIKTYTCDVCDRTKEETIDRLPHTHKWDRWQHAGEIGQHVRTCSCGEKETGTCVWGEGVTNEDPEVPGQYVRTYTCELCGYTHGYILKPVEEITNTTTSVKIESVDGGFILDENIELVVDVVDVPYNQEVLLNMQAAVGQNAKPIVAYDIELLLNDVEIQPDGNLIVTIPVPADMANYGNITVVYVDDEGNVTRHETWTNPDGTISFRTDHFSNYALVGIPKVNTSDTAMTMLYVTLLLTSAVTMLYTLNKKRRFINK